MRQPTLFDDVTTETLQDRLTASLRRRLRPESGAMEFTHQWKEVTTPGGRTIPKASASGRRTSDNDCTGWQTPTTEDAGRTGSLEMWQAFTDNQQWSGCRLRNEVHTAGWNTPRATDGANGGPNQSGGALPADAAMVVGWPTPKEQEDGRTLEQYEAARQRGYEQRKGKTSGGPASKQGGLAIAAQLAPWPTVSTQDNVQIAGQYGRKEGTTLAGAAVLASWPTPNAQEFGCVDVDRLEARRAECKERTGNGNWFGLTLGQCATLVSPWATPTTRDHKDGACQDADVPVNALLGRQACLTSGPPSTSSPAATGKRGALNPELARWLMGYPAAWGCCGATAMQSARKPRRRSSKPTAK
mgnify:CR=1 FL=1